MFDFFYYAVFPFISENIGSNDPIDDSTVKHRSDNLAQTSIEKTKFTFLSVDKHEGVKVLICFFNKKRKYILFRLLKNKSFLT